MQYPSNDDDLQYRIFGESFNFAIDNNKTIAGRRRKWVDVYFLFNPSFFVLYAASRSLSR